MSKGNNVSIFEKYHNYSKKVILISIKVITPEERMYIKYKYGSDFLGDGYLLRSEETRFAWAEKSLEEKLEKVQKMVDSGYSEEYIINNLTKVYASPYKAYSNRLKTPQLIQLKSSFTENFTPKIQLKVEKCLPNLSVEEKDLISEFYWGKKYEILKKDVDKSKIPALKKLINKIQEKYIYQLPKNVNQKSNQQSKTEFLAFFEEDKTEEVLKIVENFQVTNPNYYEVIHKLYSGERLEIRNDVILNEKEKKLLNSAKSKIRKISSGKETPKIFNQQKISQKNDKQFKTEFLAFFEEDKTEEVLKIVENFQVTNPNYYEVIHKLYSGEGLEIRNDVILNAKEKKSLNNAKAKIRKILSGKETPKIFNQQKISQKNDKQSKKGFLTFFEEDKTEEVLKIVENFQVTNPNYYEVIHKRYSGEKLEIRNPVTLSKQENMILNNAKVNIRKILSGKEAEKRSKQSKKGFLTFFEEGKSEEVLKIVKNFQVTNPNYYEAIHKRYSGERLEKRNNIILIEQEKNSLKSAKSKIRKILSGKEEMQTEKVEFLTLFGEEKSEEVLKIVEKFQITNPKYYEVIHKIYSGERLETRNNIKLSGQEKNLINNAKSKIKKILLWEEAEKKSKQYKKKFLAFFEKEKSEEVLKIVENFQVTKPNYYEVIHKIYSGERLEIRNPVTLSKQDSIILNNAKLKIKSLLKKDKKNKAHAIEDIILFLPKIIQENSIFYYIETMREKIFKIVSIDDIVDYYILHLSAFYETDIIEIIKIIATFKPEKVEMLMNSSYIKEKLQFLTPKEQMYFYLKLKSYNTTELTNKKISEILNIEESFLEQYRIMTIDEETNQLNQIIKNKNR